MKKKEGYVRNIILIVICLLLILLGVVLAAALWKQQSRYEAEKKQWEQKEQKYEKQLKKLRKQQKEDQAAETAHPNARLLENTMAEQGFKPYAGEWWHFSDEDNYPLEADFVPGK